MCSIYGVIGPRANIDDGTFEAIRERAADRGRDGGRWEEYAAPDGNTVRLGNWRATPTTETEVGRLQPYDGVVHNGTIANDVELGARPGEIDSEVLPRVLDRTSAESLARSLGRVQGSYAIACTGGAGGLLLAANFKPIHMIEHGGALYFSSMRRHLTFLEGIGKRAQALTPYSVLDVATGETVHLPREASGRALVVCSSGLDSTTAAWALNETHDVELMHFAYGCRAQPRERDRVDRLGALLGVKVNHMLIDYRQFTGGSPLLNHEAEISHGISGAEYAHEWVPARNFLMLAHAVAFAEANGFGIVALGNNLEEGGAYPDNEEQMTTLLNDVLDFAVHEGGKVRIVSPLGHLMKHEIVALGTRLGVPFGETWSCYRGGNAHCGNCGSCHMRHEAFRRNGMVDPCEVQLAAS